MYVRTTTVFFATLFIWLAVSAVLKNITPQATEVILKNVAPKATEVILKNVAPKATEVLDLRSKEPKVPSSERPETVKRLSESSTLGENKTRHLSEPYRNLMVKLGTDLKFDMSQCPTGSYMLNRSRDFSPKHSNCPTLYIVGARKGGTSSLYQYVSKHPDFQGIKLDAGAKAGEMFYFHRLKLGSWKNYVSMFPTDGTMTGESSVSYLVGDIVPKRLYDMCGNQAKVVMLFRDPLKRLESNFLMRVRYQTAKLRNKSISSAVDQELRSYFKTVAEKSVTSTPTEWEGLVGLFFPAKNMIFEGIYYVHLLNWLCNFPAENILIINSEEFFKKPSKILDTVFQFLELKRLDAEMYDRITSAAYNTGSYDVPTYQKLSHPDVVKLLEVYRPFNMVLMELLEWKNHQWLMEA